MNNQKNNLTLKSAALMIGLGLVGCSNDNTRQAVAPIAASPEPANIISVELSLTGSAQIPKLSTANSAVANIDFNENDNTLTAQLELNGIVATAAHIHSGYAGQTGAVMAAFEAVDDSASLRLDRWQLDETQLQQLLDGALYINVHSESFPEGELRAQVIVNNTEVRTFSLSSHQQVPVVTSTASGTGYLTVIPDDNTMILNVHHKALPEVLAAHVHSGEIGENGEPFLNLNPDSQQEHVLTSGVQETNAETIAQILADDTYVNIHTSQYEAGEIRGQMVSSESVIHSFSMDGLQLETPANNGYSGLGYVHLDQKTGVIDARLLSTSDNDIAKVMIVDGHSAEISTLFEFVSEAENSNRFRFEGNFSDTQIQAYLSGDWQALGYDIAEQPVMAGEMTTVPTPTGFLLDRESLVQGSALFTINYQGQGIGTAVINTSILEGNVKIEEITDAVPFGVVETLTVEMDAATGAPKSYKGTGVSGQRNIDIDLRWDANQLSGQHDLTEQEVELRLPAQHMEQLGLFYSIHAMPLAEGLVYPVTLFSGLDGSITERTLQVTGIQDVTVNAGTFETFEVLLGGAEVNQIFYITTEAPHRLVQIGFENLPITYELQAPEE